MSVSEQRVRCKVRCACVTTLCLLCLSASVKHVVREDLVVPKHAVQEIDWGVCSSRGPRNSVFKFLLGESVLTRIPKGNHICFWCERVGNDAVCYDHIQAIIRQIKQSLISQHINAIHDPCNLEDALREQLERATWRGRNCRVTDNSNLGVK